MNNVTNVRQGSFAVFVTKGYTDRLKKFARSFPDKLMDAMEEEADIEVEAIIPETPIQTGRLRRTIHRTEAQKKGSLVSIAIEAGGPEALYALTVHEDLDAYHPVGHAQFITRRLNQSNRYMPERIAKRMQFNDIVD